MLRSAKRDNIYLHVLFMQNNFFSVKKSFNTIEFVFKQFIFI
jgi:hypothetical protein